jgi:hypothetical protein
MSELIGGIFAGSAKDGILLIFLSRDFGWRKVGSTGQQSSFATAPLLGLTWRA